VGSYEEVINSVFPDNGGRSTRKKNDPGEEKSGELESGWEARVTKKVTGERLREG